MRKISIYFLISILSIFIISLYSCNNKNEDDTSADVGKLKIKFQFLESGNPLMYDTIAYTNAAGNPYSVTDLRFFISRVKLYKHGGGVQEINAWKFYHYVDIAYPNTLTWDVYDEIKSGTYDSLSFTFGLDSLDNKSFTIVNTPESNMTWPEELGGGYHYMQMNGFYMNQTNDKAGFGLHLGKGQIYDNNQNIIGYVDNDFRVSVPSSAFSVSKDKTTTLYLNMNIENWFKNPYTFDFNVDGDAIMQNQQSMGKVVANGVDVFSFGQ